MKRVLLVIWRLAGAGFIAAGIVATLADPIPTISETAKPAILTVPVPVHERPAALIET